jgi:hypothetical protein
MTKQDRKEFAAYLRQCTDNQVLGVLEKERAAKRRAYAAMAEQEASRRNLLGYTP